MSNLAKSYLHRFLNNQITDEELIRKGCFHPKELSVRPAAAKSYMPFYVDCGKCPNCVSNRRNDWVSRMCLHSLYYKHCYFVTLTYNTFDIDKYDSHPYSRLWLETYPVRCDYNSNSEIIPTPSIIVKSHATNYIKRLRLLLDSPITYAYCGEYGAKFGRPHFHFIIWSDVVISSDVFRSAWSIKCVLTKNPRVVKAYRGQKCSPYSRVDFIIGHVDCHDLVANGTLDFSSAKPNYSSFSAPHCFNYVASYITKYDSDSIPSIARKKLYAVYSVLPDSDVLYPDDMHLNVKSKKFVYNNVEYPNLTLSEFLRLVSPCFHFSRSTSIGKRYFLENFQRFENGNYSLPEFCGKKLSFPKYYFYLLQLSKQSYRIEKISFLSRSYIKGNYHVLLANLQVFRDDPSLFLSETFRKVPKIESFYTSSANGNIFDSVIYFDFERYHITYSPTFDVFEFYRFNSHIKDYEFSFYEERVDFLDFLIARISKSVKDFNQLSWDTQYNLDKLRFDLINKNPDVVDEFLNAYRYRQSQYVVIHDTTSDMQ